MCLLLKRSVSEHLLRRLVPALWTGTVCAPNSLTTADILRMR